MKQHGAELLGRLVLFACDASGDSYRHHDYPVDSLLGRNYREFQCHLLSVIYELFHARIKQNGGNCYFVSLFPRRDMQPKQFSGQLLYIAKTDYCFPLFYIPCPEKGATIFLYNFAIYSFTHRLDSESV